MLLHLVHNVLSKSSQSNLKSKLVYLSWYLLDRSYFAKNGNLLLETVLCQILMMYLTRDFWSNSMTN